MDELFKRPPAGVGKVLHPKVNEDKVFANAVDQFNYEKQVLQANGLSGDIVDYILTQDYMESGAYRQARSHLECVAGALAKVRALRQAGLLAPNFGVDDDTAAQAGFRQGRCAFLLTSPGFIRKLIGGRLPFLVLPPPTLRRWGHDATMGVAPHSHPIIGPTGMSPAAATSHR